MPIYEVHLTGQATVICTQRIFAESEAAAEEKAVNYASIRKDHEGWQIDPDQNFVDITAAAFKLGPLGPSRLEE